MFVVGTRYTTTYYVKICYDADHSDKINVVRKELEREVIKSRIIDPTRVIFVIEFKYFFNIAYDT